MKIPICHSEDMRATGGTRSELIENVLDSSISLDKWTVFLRETLQNSNDQRLPESPEITFGLHYEMLSAEGKSTIKKMFDQPGPHQSDEKICLNSSSLADVPILIVSDSGTRGLSGGTDARKEDDSNFCNFFYFSGQLESRTTGGGSYGIGRNVLFSASRSRTIVVYSQIIHEGQPEQRFMAMAASKGVKHDGLNYTGRHWWGSKRDSQHDGVDPILGNDALELAKAFGLEKHLIKGTGTVIGVIDPEMENPSEQMSGLGMALLINAWPHLVKKGTQKKTLTASITFLGDGVKIPDPRSAKSPVKHFVDAYLEDQTAAKVFVEDFKFNGSLDHLRKWVKNEDKFLGRLTWKKVMNEKAPLQDYTEKGLSNRSSVALMRSAKLIVEYLPVSSPDDGSTVFGVFSVGENFEKAFRKAETATHDKWLSSRLDLAHGSRNPIKQAEDGINRVFQSAKNHLNQTTDNLGTPVLLANQLGRLIAGIGVTGGFIPPSTSRGGGSGGGSKKYRIEATGQPKLISRNAGTCTGEFFFRVAGKSQVGVEMAFKPSVKVWLGDTFEKDAPAGTEPPAVRQILTQTPGTSEWVEVKGKSVASSHLSEGMNLKIVVVYPSDVQVACSFDTEITGN